MKIFLFKKTPAFTLIELLIVMVMLAILATVSYNGIISARNHSRLVAATDTVMGVIQTARSYALSNMELEVDSETCSVTDFRVTFDTSSIPNSVTINADLTGCTATREVLKQEFFSEDILITSEFPTDYIQYDPPLADVTLSPDYGAYNEITLSTQDELLSKTIQVYDISGFPEVVD